MKKYKQSLLFRVYRAFDFYHGPGNETRHRRLAYVYAFAAWNAAGLGLYTILKTANVQLDPAVIEEAKRGGTFYTISTGRPRESPPEESEEFPDRPNETIVQ